MAKRRRAGEPDPEPVESLLQRYAAEQEQRARQELDEAVQRRRELVETAERLRRVARWRRRKRSRLQGRLRDVSLRYAFALRLWLIRQSAGPVGPRPPAWLDDDIAQLRTIMAREGRDRDAERARQRSLRRHQRRLRQQDRVDPAERAFLEYARRYVSER